MIFPVGVAQLFARFEDGDDAAFEAIAAVIDAGGGIARGGGGAEVLRLGKQGGLVVLDLDDQGEVGAMGDLEEFF